MVTKVSSESTSDLYFFLEIRMENHQLFHK